jgi:hypothetical protein
MITETKRKNNQLIIEWFWDDERNNDNDKIILEKISKIEILNIIGVFNPSEDSEMGFELTLSQFNKLVEKESEERISSFLKHIRENFSELQVIVDDEQV